MSTSFDITVEEEVNISISSLDEITSDNNNKYHNKYGLKYKNLLKHRQRCKVLRKKLKKYKLRKDGKEDQDVLDVSEVFNSSLIIKSAPKRNSDCLDIKLEDFKPKNYLFKMARRKHKAKTEKLNNVSQVVDTPNHINMTSVSPISASQEQSKTNAFKLMMDSRNKSIGSNSPGKEKDIDSCDLQEITEKKNLKAKRNLVLQKMAEAKGSLKKIEIEEFQEKCIQRKMEKRAERLKEMIKNTKGTISYDQEIKSKAPKENEKKSKSHDDKVNDLPNTTVQLFDIFKDPLNISPDKKPVSKEDEEFMKKLSPSIKKKENMLSYFKKIEKQPEPIFVDIDPENNISPIIKVKFSTKHKKKLKKRKLSLKKEQDTGENLKHHDENEPCVNGSTENNIEHKENNNIESRKRKRKEPSVKELGENNEINNDVQSKLEEGRPKRNVRKPVKYTDNVQLNSSDEELHVFTPKKKRHVENKEKTTAKYCDDVIVLDDKPKKNAMKSKKVYSESKQQTHPTKLAPIFATKPQLNQEQLEARQKFLYSGVPNQLKKIIAQQKNTNTESTNYFPTVVHVQQIDIIQKLESNILIPPYIKCHYDQNEEVILDDSSLFHRLVKLTEKKYNHCMDVKKNSISTVLQSLKECYPKFPVYRTYRLLKGVSKGEIKEISTDLENSVEIVNGLSETINSDPEYLNWTDKYKPKSTKHLLGNFESVRELKKWLESWTENHSNFKNTLGSDISDFYDSDTDSKDSIKTANNLLILTGPLGSGKTSSVYAVAAELAMKVIEVNASSKRTGKMMLQDLQEATQSHKVNRDNSQKSQEVIVEPFILKTYKKKGRPKKYSDEKPKSVDKKETLSQQSSNQEVGRTAMSLILIDDADIVFDQDDGFSSAIAQLVQSSKRPVVLVTASLSCSHLQRFLQFGKVIKMRPFSPRMLGTWLDLLCLADSGTCWPGLGAKFLDYFKGDIRKSINNLQFYMTTQESASDEATSQNSDIKSSLEDENSCTSWDGDGAESRSVVPKFTIGLENEVWKSFVLQQSNFLNSASSLKLMDLWWNMPLFFNSCDIQLQTVDSCKNKRKQSLELKAMADIVDNLSVSDYFSQLTPDTSSNISSLPWYTSESDSVSENENSDCYSRSDEIHNEIVHHLTRSSVMEAQKVFGLEKDIDLQFPDMATQR